MPLTPCWLLTNARRQGGHAFLIKMAETTWQIWLDKFYKDAVNALLNNSHIERNKNSIVNKNFFY